MSLAARRLTEAAQAAPCASICLRCLRRVQEGTPHVQCQFAQSDMLITQFKVDGKQGNRCHYCCTKGENCYKIDESMEADMVKLVDLMAKCPTQGSTVGGAQELLDVQAQADLMMAYANSKTPFGNNFFIHDGKDGDSQSGVVGMVRSRAKDHVLRKDIKRKRKLAESESEEEAFGTPKKGKHGIRGTAETPAERAARIADQLASPTRGRARAVARGANRGGRSRRT